MIFFLLHQFLYLSQGNRYKTIYWHSRLFYLVAHINYIKWWSLIQHFHTYMWNLMFILHYAQWSLPFYYIIILCLLVNLFYFHYPVKYILHVWESRAIALESSLFHLMRWFPLSFIFLQMLQCHSALWLKINLG